MRTFLPSPLIPKLSLLFSLLILILFTGSGPEMMRSKVHGSASESTELLMVAVHTDFGTMKLVLYNETPKHRDNFLKLARKGFFDGTIFHRVIEGFMIQGGDPHSKKDVEGKVGEGDPGYTLEAEIHEELFHKKGALAAARKGDRVNPEKRSNGSQFYIVDGKKYSRKDLKKLEERIRARREGFSFSEEQLEAYSSEGGAPHLDGAYTVFGQLVEGMEVLEKIASVKVDPSKGNRPKERIEMEIEVIE